MRRAPSSSIWSWRHAVLLLAFVVICAVHGPLIGYKTFANVDEAYASAIAARLLDGFKMYDGAVSQRGPLMYYVYEVIAWLHGWDNIVALRFWALGFALLHLGCVFWVGRALLSRNAAIVATAVTAYALTFGFPPYDVYALHGEAIQLPPLMMSVLLGALAFREPPGRTRRVRLAVAGVFLGIAIAIKQSVLLHPVPLFLWMVIDARRNRGSVRTLVLDGLATIAGIIVVPALLILEAWQKGTLRELYYYCVTYNRTIHLAPTKKVFPWLGNVFLRLGEHTIFFILLALLAGVGLGWVVRRARAARRAGSVWVLGRGFGPVHYLGLHLVLAMFAASAMYRFFPHYYLQAAPFVALMIGHLVDRWTRGRSGQRVLRVGLGGFLVFVFACGVLGCVFGERIDGRVAHDKVVQITGKYIEATTKPTDRIFVWGFSSWLYQYSHRKPAGRYVFETYVTGFVPWFWDKLSVEKSRIVPGSQEALLGDLDREKPEVVVDAGSVMMARSMRGYELSNAWLHQHYCFEVRLGPFDIYRRKADGAQCALPYFPRVHPAISWGGGFMPFPMPLTVDFASSRRLPDGNYNKPLWFTEGPIPPAAGLDATRDPRLEEDERKAVEDGFYIPSLESDTPRSPCPPAAGAN